MGNCLSRSGLKTPDRIEGQGTVCRKNTVRQSSVADEYFKVGCNAEIRC